MQDLFTHTPRKDIYSLLKSIGVFTLAVEGGGAFVLTLSWSHSMPLPHALFAAVFHSVSAFCNAGFALFSDSMMRFSANGFVNLCLIALIVIGGLGFPVLFDIQSWLKRRKKERVRLSVQTKTVLLTTLILILAGALIFGLLERQSLGKTPSNGHRILVPLFQSVTCRTAGFNTVDIAALKDVTLVMMMFLMFFGASPGSCGGGVKTTTLALIIAFTYCRVRKYRRVNMFKKSIPVETVTRSMSLVLVSISIICLILFMLMVGDSLSGHEILGPRGVFLPYLFETVSAFGTVGLSMGITAALDAWDKVWIIIMMIIGRVGVLTFSYIIVGSGATYGIEYSEENMMIG
jgi:trk system potassium uptake protein TrkH